MPQVINGTSLNTQEGFDKVTSTDKGNFPNWLSHVYIFSGILLVTYVCIMIWGPDGRTVEGLPIQVASQKIIVFSIGVSVIVQALGLINHIKKT